MGYVFKVFGLTQLGIKPTAYQFQDDTLPLDHWVGNIINSILSTPNMVEMIYHFFKQRSETDLDKMTF